MSRGTTWLGGLVGLLVWSGAVLASPEPPPASPEAAGQAEASEASDERLDARAFFETLAQRYRDLAAYRDTAHVVQVTETVGEKPHRVETRIICTIEEGKLRIETPGAAARDAVNLDLPVKMSPAMEAWQLRYNLWLAPHLVLIFVEKPLADFRLGVEEGFTVARAERVTIEDRPVVHLVLESRHDEGEARARFDLFVDAGSMLIERIEGRQRLPDGGQYRTRLDITPKYAEAGKAVGESVEAREEPTDPSDGPGK